VAGLQTATNEQFEALDQGQTGGPDHPARFHLRLIQKTNQRKNGSTPNTTTVNLAACSLPFSPN
jgi:hypothetical protein